MDVDATMALVGSRVPIGFRGRIADSDNPDRSR